MHPDPSVGYLAPARWLLSAGLLAIALGGGCDKKTAFAVPEAYAFDTPDFSLPAVVAPKPGRPRPVLPRPVLPRPVKPRPLSSQLKGSTPACPLVHPTHPSYRHMRDTLFEPEYKYYERLFYQCAAPKKMITLPMKDTDIAMSWIINKYLVRKSGLCKLKRNDFIDARNALRTYEQNIVYALGGSLAYRVGQMYSRFILSLPCQAAGRRATFVKINLRNQLKSAGYVNGNIHRKDAAYIMCALARKAWKNKPHDSKWIMWKGRTCGKEE